MCAFHSKTCFAVLWGMHAWSAGSYGNPTPNFSRARLNGPIVTAPFTSRATHARVKPFGGLHANRGHLGKQGARLLS